MARVKIFSTAVCPICDKTKTLLTKWCIDYQEALVDQNRDELKEMLKITDGARTVPQIVIDGKWIGGFTELTELHMEGKLDELISD
ncbi:MAG: glutaredoxin domain-containing protein [Thioalkalispiraceae bacterium]|jgi:glutaredoxin 3